MPDVKRGEQLVLITEQADAARPALVAAAREAGLLERFVPRAIVHVSAVRVLGTGKIDYVQVGRLALESVPAPATSSTPAHDAGRLAHQAGLTGLVHPLPSLQP